MTLGLVAASMLACAESNRAPGDAVRAVHNRVTGFWIISDKSYDRPMTRAKVVAIREEGDTLYFSHDGQEWLRFLTDSVWFVSLESGGDTTRYRATVQWIDSGKTAQVPFTELDYTTYTFNLTLFGGEIKFGNDKYPSFYRLQDETLGARLIAAQDSLEKEVSGEKGPWRTLFEEAHLAARAQIVAQTRAAIQEAGQRRQAREDASGGVPEDIKIRCALEVDEYAIAFVSAGRLDSNRWRQSTNNRINMAYIRCLNRSR